MLNKILENLKKSTILGVCAFACTAALATFASAATPAPDTVPTESGDSPAKGDDADDLSKYEKTLTAKPAGTAQSFSDYLQGKFAEEQGDASHAIDHLRDSLKRDPNNMDVLKSLYRMLVFSGRIDEAVPLARKLEATNIADEDDYGEEFTPQMLLAVDEVKKGEFKEADTHVAAIPEPHGVTLEVTLLRAWFKLGMGKVTQPIDPKTMTPEGHVIYPHVYLNAAFINDIAGFDKEAQKQYEAAVKDPKIEPFRAVEALANFYARKGMEDKRRKLVEDYLADHGDTYLADEILLTPETGHSQPLVGDAKQGVAEAFYTMASILNGEGTVNDEIAILNLALYLRPNYPPSQFLLANAYEYGQEYKRSAEIYKAIDKNSAYSFRGRIRAAYDEMQAGQKEKAMAELDVLIKERPKEIDALMAKGDLLQAEKRYKDAIEAYDEAEERVDTPSKRHWSLFYRRATAYQMLNNWTKAEADAKKALELSPAEPEVLNYLGYTWLTMHKDVPKAKKMIEDAYDAAPDEGQIIDSMGYALYVTGDFAGAEEYFDRALEHAPNDPTINDHLGDTYWQLGRKTEARFQWERALADSPDAETEKGLQKKLKEGMPLVHAAQAAKSKVEAKPSTDE